MLCNLKYEIPSCDDEELKIKRKSLLNFSLCFDNAKKIKAFLFIIPGLGEDSNKNYREHLAQYVAQNYEVAVVSVDYHYCGNRPQTGCEFYLDKIDKLILEQNCKVLNLKLLDAIEQINSYESLHRNFTFLDSQLNTLKAQGLFRQNYRIKLSVTVKAKRNEYQNFGIMQAQDCLNALLYLKQNPAFEMGGGVALYNARFFSRRIFSPSLC